MIFSKDSSNTHNLMQSTTEQLSPEAREYTSVLRCLDNVALWNINLFYFICFQAMFEVITSEASYLKSLHIVVSHFMSAMLPVTNGPPEEQLLDRQQFHFIFGGLTSIKAISERYIYFHIQVSHSFTFKEH